MEIEELLNKACKNNKYCKIKTKDGETHIIKNIDLEAYENKIWCLSDDYFDNWMSFIFEYNEIITCEIL